MNIRLKPFVPNGNIVAPPSKSDSHRKIICGALSKGYCVVDNIILSEDISATIEALVLAGYKIDLAESNGYPGRKKAVFKGLNGEISDNRIINCRESGSTLRFMAMIFAAIGGKTTFTGMGRLPERPMQHAIDFYKKYGISYSIPGNRKFLPLEISGKLTGKQFELDASVSSQFISGLLMGLAAAGEGSSVFAKGKFESKGYVDMTVDVLKSFGTEIEGDNPYRLIKTGGLKSINQTVEGDWSNASYFIAINSMKGGLNITGLDENSSQPDRIFKKLIGQISLEERNFVDVSEFPDLMPTIAVVASTLPVMTTITGKRLRYKESDRIKSVKDGLENLGIEVKELEDGLEIRGGGEITGGIINSYNDHRIAMAFSVLSCVASGDIIIKGAECIDKSYPEFFLDMERVGGIIE